MKHGIVFALLLASCAQKTVQPTPAATTAGDNGARAGAGNALSGGGSAGDEVSQGGPAEAGGGEARPDLFDDSGCEHPRVIANCSNGWCKLPPGCFIMGSPETEWSHAPQEKRVKVTLTRGFIMAEREVTQAEWLAEKLPNPSKLVADQGDCADTDCPIGNVNWFEAASYANLMSDKEGLEPCYDFKHCVGNIGQDPSGLVCEDFTITTKTIYDCNGYRLPTDPEWEYAARSGSRSAFYAGDITTRREVGVCVEEPALGAIAWYCSNAGTSTRTVGKLKPNAWGLFDMIGNALEWVNDQSGWVPTAEALTDPEQTYGAGQGRDTRGGGYFGWPGACRAAARVGLSASFRSPGLGFRLVRTLHP